MRAEMRREGIDRRLFSGGDTQRREESKKSDLGVTDLSCRLEELFLADAVEQWTNKACLHLAAKTSTRRAAGCVIRLFGGVGGVRRGFSSPPLS